MTKMKVIYEGDLHTCVTHVESGESLHTDAPKDNGGEGKTFSPTDLVGVALASCIATVMGIYAKRHEIDLKGLKVEVEKKMTATAPRRIGELIIDITFPENVTAEQKEALLRVGNGCPVHHSLHPELKISIS